MVAEFSQQSVDVVIPAHNSERFVKESIQSVLDQTLLPNKIIIVDDGSTDSTVEIINGFDSDLIEVISVKHGGVSRARNIGIKTSEADYIAFLDADDVWSPTKLEAQIRQLLSNDAAGVCYCGVQLIDEAGAEIANGYGEPYVRGNVFEDIVLYGRQIHGSASSVIVARDVLLKTTLFDETMQFSEDTDLWARLSMVTEFDFVNAPDVKVRSHYSSVTRRKNWDKSKVKLLQHFHYINKFADTHKLAKKGLSLHELRILGLFFYNPSKVLELRSLYYSLKEAAPHLIKQLRYNNLSLFIVRILWVASKEGLWLICTRPHLVKRTKLLFSEGTILFSRSKNYNHDVVSMWLKR